MAECILLRGGGADLDVVTAGRPDVLAGKVIVNKDGEPLTGTMPNRGAISQALNAGGSYTIPEGYHSGAGKVTTNSLASQTGATATAAHILSGQTAWVNGSRVTGSLPNRGQGQFGGWGEGSDYYAVNKLPEGAYFKSGADWAPEARVEKDKVRSGLGISSDKIKAGQQIAGVWGNVQELKVFHTGGIRTTGSSMTFSNFGNTTVNLAYIDIYTGIDNPKSVVACGDNALIYHTFYDGYNLIINYAGNDIYGVSPGSQNTIWGSTIRIPVASTRNTYSILVTGY